MFSCRFAIILVLATFISLSGAQSDNGRIVGGIDAVANQIPYIASLRWTRGNDLHFCGASIIRPNWVLTAAHCIDGVLDDEVIVVVGSTLLSSGGYEHQSVRIIPHPEYDGVSLWADVAVVEVGQPFAYNDAVQPILIGREHINESSAIVSGWGMLNHTYEDYPLPDQLQVLSTRIITNQACRNGHPDYADYIFDSKVCTFTEMGQGICMGDSGGPLVVGNYVVGIPSWVIPCGIGYPDVYARVSSFAEWIIGVVDAED